MNIRKLNPSPAMRIWLYGLGVAGGALLVYQGILTDEALVLWLGLLAAALNVQAAANVDAQPKPQQIVVNVQPEPELLDDGNLDDGLDELGNSRGA